MTSRKVAFAAALAVWVGSWSASASGASSPLQGTRELVAAITAPDQKQRGAMKKVRPYFDYDHLVRVPIEPHKKKLSPEQLKRYSQMFRELLENAPLIASLGNGDKLDYTIGKPVETKGEVKVGLQAYDSETDMDTDVAFHWRRIKGAWQIVDVTLDGASMLKGYQNQFGRILRKEGAEGFLARLEKRLADVKAKKSTGT